MRNLSLLTAGVSFLALQLLASTAFADDTIAARIGKLEQELAILKRQAEIDKEEAAKNVEKTPIVELSKKGFEVKSADKSFELKLRGLIQADGRFSIHDKNDTSTDQFLLRKIRPILQGKIFNTYNYYFMPDFGNGQTKVFDAYLEAAVTPTATIRAGKFKPPIGLEALQSDENVAFAERGLPSSLVPSRDVGLQLYGNLLDDKLGYQAGIFNGTTDGGSNDLEGDDSKEVALRLFATPFTNSNHLKLQGLGVGIAGSYGEKDGTNTATQLDVYKTPAQTTYFRYRTGTDNVYADGTHQRIVPQAYYYVNSFGILGEYTVSSQEIRYQNRRSTLDNSAWGVTASYVLTGEDASYKGVKPANNFNPRNGAWGAVELVGRYAELSIDNKAFPIFADPAVAAKGATDIGAGINWYLNDNVRLVVDYGITSFDGGARNNQDRPDEQTLFTRAQYKF